MSYLTSISGLVGTGGMPPGPAAPAPLIPALSRAAPAPVVSAAAAPAEATQTAASIPPVTGARGVNSGSAMRPGADGRADPARPDAEREDVAKREEEAALRELLQKELLARVPVPIQAIPKLAGDLEQVRSIGDGRDPANAPTRPTDPAA